MERSPSAQRAPKRPFFPQSRGVSRVDNRKLLAASSTCSPMGCTRVDAPAVHGPHKTLYNRFRRWSVRCLDLAVLGAGLIDGTATEEEALLMDAPWVKADRTAASRKRGCCPMLDWSHLAED